MKQAYSFSCVFTSDSSTVVLITSQVAVLTPQAANTYTVGTEPQTLLVIIQYCTVINYTNAGNALQ